MKLNFIGTRDNTIDETITQRPITKILQHLEDALFHLYNVRGLSHDQIQTIGSTVANTRQIIHDAFEETR